MLSTFLWRRPSHSNDIESTSKLNVLEQGFWIFCKKLNLFLFFFKGSISTVNIESCLTTLFKLSTNTTIPYNYKLIDYRQFTTLFRHLEETTQRRKRFRRCLRSLARSCDVNKDTRISWKEFNRCFNSKDKGWFFFLKFILYHLCKN